MSLVPAFELGLWNAWILVVAFFLINAGLISLIERKFNYKESRPSRPTYDEKEEKLTAILMGSVIASFIYSFFLPLKLGTVWFYVGLSFYILGMISVTAAQLYYVSAPQDKPLTKGVYHVSRHPMWFGFFLILLGMGIACASWICLLLSTIFIVLQHILVGSEERWCLEHYGDAYREYMKKTPRWIGIPKPRGNDERT
jgi:protein-S-isoprenylcysteine O-methyltransferase Ste14